MTIFDWDDDFDEDDEIDIVRRSAANRKSRKRRILNIDIVLDWADAHRARTGRWPTRPIPSKVHEDPHETWDKINWQCLRPRKSRFAGRLHAAPTVIPGARGSKSRPAPASWDSQDPQMGRRPLSAPRILAQPTLGPRSRTQEP